MNSEERRMYVAGAASGAATVLVILLTFLVVYAPGSSPTPTAPAPSVSRTYQSTVATIYTYTDGRTDYVFANTLRITTDRPCGYSVGSTVSYNFETFGTPPLGGSGYGMIQLVGPPKTCGVNATAIPGDFVQS